MLVRWLPRNEVDQIPPYAHTMVGVGGMVIAEDRDEVLVVREKYYKQPHWKLPGGFVEPGKVVILGGIEGRSGDGIRYLQKESGRTNNSSNGKMLQLC